MAYVEVGQIWFRTNSIISIFSLFFSHEFRSLLASSGGWGLLRLRAAMAHTMGRGLRFDAPVAVSREFWYVSTLPLWFRD